MKNTFNLNSMQMIYRNRVAFCSSAVLNESKVTYETLVL